MKLHVSKSFKIKKVMITFIIIITIRITKNMFKRNVGFQYCSYFFV
jgi:hypothetical protein